VKTFSAEQVQKIARNNI